MLLSLAELKQVKDILSGDIPGPGHFADESENFEKEKTESQESESNQQ